MSILIGKKAPNFTANAVFEEEIREITLSDYKGKYVILFFYPLDFTFVCPTELHAFQTELAEFKKRNVELLACSVDSEFSHLAWLKTPKHEGGINGIQYGIISDLGGEIAREYDVLKDKVALRGLFLIDKEGIVQHQIVNNLPLGRNTQEALRMVDALQHFEQHGQVCPANWMQGKEAISANRESTAKYLSKLREKI